MNERTIEAHGVLWDSGEPYQENPAVLRYAGPGNPMDPADPGRIGYVWRTTGPTMVDTIGGERREATFAERAAHEASLAAGEC